MNDMETKVILEEANVNKDFFTSNRKENNLKCPFCQQELDTGGYYVHCHNPHCNTTVEMEGTEEMWEALIRTRKALNFGVDVLKEIDELLSSNKFDVREVPLLSITQIKISMLLKCITKEQITTLTKGSNNENFI